MFDDENVSLAAADEQRIKDALAALRKDPHAAREISVTLSLHIHNEYPKCVTVGEDKDGNAIVKVVNSQAEEDDLLESLQAAASTPGPVAVPAADPQAAAAEAAPPTSAASSTPPTPPLSV